MAIRSDHVIPYIGAKSSGPAHSVPGLCNGLQRCGVNVQLHTLMPLPPEQFSFVMKGYPRHRFPLAKLGRSPEMKQALCERAREVDILHNHSLWMLPNLYPADAIKNTFCKLVVSPRGTMSEYSWARSRWRKRAIQLLGQQAVLRRTDMFHATSEAEVSDIRRLGFRQPVALIPNGVAVPTPRQSQNFATDALDERRVVLFLSRIHPEKNVALLLKVWQSFESQRSDFELWICGPLGGQYAKDMIKLSEELGLKRALFKGEVIDDQKRAAFHRSDLFILPSTGENFGMAVAEALAHGVPAIVSKGAPWKDLETHACGWWVDNDEKVLLDTLLDAAHHSREELRNMGRRGSHWMESQFGWDAISQRMLGAYDWLLHGGSTPQYVYVD